MGNVDGRSELLQSSSLEVLILPTGERNGGWGNITLHLPFYITLPKARHLEDQPVLHRLYQLFLQHSIL